MTMRTGILNLFKPTGLTSHDIVDRVRFILKENKVGHSGTLDPFAEGVLLVGFGRGTKILSYLSDLSKGYEAVIRLVESTDTLDREGKIVRTMPVPKMKAKKIDQILSLHVGRQEQTPPEYSAVWINGVRAYKLARSGKKVNIPPRTITVKSLSLISWDPPFLSFKAVVSKGTYIRRLASDLADHLGTCGHLISLKRTFIGDYQIDSSLSLEELEKEVALDRLSEVALTLSEAIHHLPSVKLDKQGVRMLRNGLYPRGHFILPGELAANSPAAAIGPDGQLVAIVKARQEKGVRQIDEAVFKIVRVISG